MSNQNDWIDALKYAHGHERKYPGIRPTSFAEATDTKKEMKKQLDLALKKLDRIETKLDKLLGPQLINGIWR